MVSYLVTKAQEGKELFEVLESVYPDFSIKDQDIALKYGDVELNGKEVDGEQIVHEGDAVDIFLCGDTVGIDLTPKIVYQDENFVIVDKPAGLLSISERDKPNAVTMVETFMKEQGEYNVNALMVPYLVYRLDKYVSGLLMLAKHEEGYLFLIEALNQRRINRHFLCPVIGIADESDELMAYYMKDKALSHSRILGKFQKGAKPIVTRYTAEKIGENMSLLMARPVTSGLHQTRAHLAYYGLPVLGDDKYGDKRFNRKCRADRIAMCLKSLVFETGKGHEYEYLNGKSFESEQVCFPKCVYDEGLME